MHWCYATRHTFFSHNSCRSTSNDETNSTVHNLSHTILIPAVDNTWQISTLDRCSFAFRPCVFYLCHSTLLILCGLFVEVNKQNKTNIFLFWTFQNILKAGPFIMHSIQQWENGNCYTTKKYLFISHNVWKQKYLVSGETHSLFCL